MKTVAASELKPGDCFKLSTRHRKVKTISKVIDLDGPGRRETTTPEVYQKAYENRLLFMDGCQQTILFKNEKVLLVN